MKGNPIRLLNDQFHKAGPGPDRDWVATRGVMAKGDVFVHTAIVLTRAYNSFTSDNDPRGEHDFGSFTLAREKLYWKIDYYDKDLKCGSDDPADPDKTRRVMTILLAEEY